MAPAKITIEFNDKVVRQFLLATLIWLVGITNAINWLDGLDGLAAGVSGIAAIVGASWFVSSWKWIWAPIGDYTLSRKVWYRIAIALVSIGFLALSSIPPGPRTAGLLSLIVLMTSLAGTFIAFSVADEDAAG